MIESSSAKQQVSHRKVPISVAKIYLELQIEKENVRSIYFITTFNDS